LSDAIDLFLDGELVEAGKRQRQKQTDSSIDPHERVAK
jgi:hypothetical protein